MALVQNPPPSRLMMSGPCTAIAAVVGENHYPCACLHGKYNILLSGVNPGDMECVLCTHSLFHHKDIEDHKDTEDNMALSPAHKFDTGQLSDPIRCPREHTVAALWKRIQQVGVVHIRGTPASGKTTLSRLLEEHVKKEMPSLTVLWASWPMDFHSPELNQVSQFDKLLGRLFGRCLSAVSWWDARALIIIDEAQASYRYTSLWNDLIKSITPTSILKIALFASYGSPSSIPEVEMPVPVVFQPNQRISIRRSPQNPDLALFFNRTEFDDIVERTCKYHCQGQQAFLPSSELIDYVWEITNGHPAGVPIVLNGLATSKLLRPFRKNSAEISLDAALGFLQSNDFTKMLVDNGIFQRGLPVREVWKKDPSIAQFLRKVLAFNRSEDDWRTNDALNVCYRRGWLQAELTDDPEPEPVYIFASKLHQRCVEHELSIQVPPFPSHRFSSLTELCFAVIHEFNPIALSSKQGLGPGAELRPLEAQYRDEFRRACYTLLGSTYLTSEWSGKEKSGRVDLLVGCQRWAIECVRDGDRLLEHISRFREGGRYFEWIKSEEIRDYVLLDFRQSKPQRARDDVPWLYSVVFSDDFKIYHVYDAELNLVVGPIAL